MQLHTQAQFQAAYSQIYQDFAIVSFTNTKVGGYDATELVFTYSSENVEYENTMYNVVVGDGYRGFSCVCPLSNTNDYEAIYASIMASVQFTN